VTEEERAKKTALCGRVFSPAAPVNKLTLFAGRLGEIRKISEAINTRGRHAIMYGDRGVGKTSLATVLNDLFRQVEGLRIVKINCVETDTFRNAWRKAFTEITHIREPNPQFEEETNSLEATLADHLDSYEEIGPGEIRHLLRSVSQEDFELVVVFDEFDRLPKEERGLFSDTVKDLSDNSINTTLVLVGVARDVVDLISDHASIDRCLTQILMPPMDRDELRDILNKAMTALGMKMNDDAGDLIVFLSQGLPHYAHLLGQESSFKALSAGRSIITTKDVNGAITEALQKSQQTIRNDYLKAAEGQRKGTLFPEVLLACALADVDELGYFSSANVRGPLCGITGEEYDIPNFSQHLDKFSTDSSRGPVLEKWGTRRRFRFRFRNPLLRPFIIMKGLADGKISGNLLEQLGRREPARPPDNPDQKTLFD
jgi:Cdc6-like AAA superfamily ATPase